MIKLLKKERTKGEVERARKDILEILEERFGKVPEDVKKSIRRVNDLKKLSLLHRKSAVVTHSDEFKKFLEDV